MNKKPGFLKSLSRFVLFLLIIIGILSILVYFCEHSSLLPSGSSVQHFAYDINNYLTLHLSEDASREGAWMLRIIDRIYTWHRSQQLRPYFMGLLLLWILLLAARFFEKTLRQKRDKPRNMLSSLSEQNKVLDDYRQHITPVSFHTMDYIRIQNRFPNESSPDQLVIFPAERNTLEISLREDRTITLKREGNEICLVTASTSNEENLTPLVRGVPKSIMPYTKETNGSPAVGQLTWLGGMST